MTIEQLLELPADDIAKLTDKELEAHLRKYFPYTRPSGVIDNALAVSLDKQTMPEDDPMADYEKRILEQHAKAKAAQAAKPAIPLGKSSAKIRITK